MILKFRLLEEKYLIARYSKSIPIQEIFCGTLLNQVLCEELFSFTANAEEVSLVCSEEIFKKCTSMPEKLENDWRCIKLEGPYPFTATGILNAVLTPLALANIGIFALSTFNTDYILIKCNQFDSALDVLQKSGHLILASSSLY